jgi:hypothetical protein
MHAALEQPGDGAPLGLADAGGGERGMNGGVRGSFELGDERERWAPGCADGGLAAGQAERAQARHPLETGGVPEQCFAAPDGAVGTEAGAVPGEGERGTGRAVLGEQRRQVRVVRPARSSRPPAALAAATAQRVLG